MFPILPACYFLRRVSHRTAACLMAVPFVLALPVLQTQAQEPATPRLLQFEAPHIRTAPGGALEEQGFLMKPPQGKDLTLASGSTPVYANNGSNYAKVSFQGKNCTIVHRDGLPFSVTKVDLAENGGLSTVVTFYGKLMDGTTVINSFQLDNANDGVGPGEDFQTFTFSPNFSRIVELGITTASYCLDNLQLTLHGSETPEPPRPQAPLVYEIDWNDAPHALNQPIALGGPRAPSSLSHGSPTVRSRVGGLQDRPVELSEQNGNLVGFYLEAGLGAGRYVLEFDATAVGSASLSVSMSHTHGWIETQFLSNMSHSHLTFSDPGGPVGSNPTQLFSPQAVNHVRMEFDPAGGRVEVALNGKVTGTWTLPARAAVDLNNVRFYSRGDGQAGVDNIKLSAYERSALVVTPASYKFGTVPVGTDVNTRFTLRNTGDAPLTVTGATSLGADAVWLNLTFPFTIPAHENVVGVMAVRPSSPTSYSNAARFFTSDGAAQVNWAMVGTQANAAVQFPRQPASVIHLTDLPANALSFTPAVTGASTGFQWLRNGVPIPSGTNIQLSIPASTPANMAGDYRLRIAQSSQVHVYSRTARVGVAGFKSTTQQAAVGSRVEATAAGVGEGLTFAWRHNGRLLTGTETGVTITGDGTSLVLDPVQPEHQGVYIAHAQMPDAHDGAVISVPAVTLNLTVPQPPRIVTQELHHWQVGRQQFFNMAPTGTGQWSATGLPPGLQIHPSTGVIFGTVEGSATPDGVPVRYQPIFTLLNGQMPASAPVQLDLWVHPTAPTGTQTYVGIIQPGKVGGDPRRLGGRLRFTVSPSGAYTATLQMPLRTMSTNSVDTGALTYRPRDGVLAGRVAFISSIYSLEYQVQIDSAGHLQTEDMLGTPNGIFEGWRVLPKLNAAIHQAGSYPAALLRGTPEDLDSPPLRFGIDTPAGSGVLHVTLLASGRANYSGTLADGTSVTGSEQVTANLHDPAQLHLPVFLNAPANRGSAVGWLTCQGSELDGDLMWQKIKGQYDLGYRAGFENVSLLAIGERHIAKPATATHFGRMGILGSQQNLEITAIDLHPQLNATFNISTTGRITRLPVTGQTIATLTLQPGNATFRGTVDLGSYRGMIVRGSYQGVFVPRLGRGFGFCYAVDYAYFSRYMTPRVHFSRSVRLTGTQGG